MFRVLAMTFASIFHVRRKTSVACSNTAIQKDRAVSPYAGPSTDGGFCLLHFLTRCVLGIASLACLLG